MEDSQQNVQEATALPVPQPAAEQPPEREASVLLKRSVFVMLIVGIVVALLVGYGIGRLTTISRDNVVIAQKNSKIEKLNTSLQSVKKQLADATRRLIQLKIQVMIPAIIQKINRSRGRLVRPWIMAGLR